MRLEIQMQMQKVTNSKPTTPFLLRSEMAPPPPLKQTKCR